MNELIEGKNQEELSELWQKLKQEKKIIDQESDRLYEKIENECEEVREKYSNSENALLESAPEEVRKLVKIRNKLRKNLDYSKRIFLMFTISFFTLVIIRKEVFLKLEQEYDTIPAHLILIGASLALAWLFTTLYNKIIRWKIYKIQRNEQVRLFNDAVLNIDEIAEKEIEYIEKEKYKVERERFDAFYKKYKSVRSLMIKEEYGDSAFFYFGEFGEFGDKDVCYEINVDGITVAYSRDEKFQRIGINPGYHTIDLILYSFNKEHYLTFHFQVSEKNLPLCVECDKVSAHYGKCWEVTFEEFDKRHGYYIK